MGLFATGTSCFALVWVMGRRRVPLPPLRMSAFSAAAPRAPGAVRRAARAPDSFRRASGWCRLVVDGLEVDRDREGRPDLILPAIAFSDRLRVVVLRAKE